MKWSHRFCIAIVLLAGCRQDMNDQPRYKPLAQSDFFGDDRSARPQVPDTVARGQLRTNELLYTGKIGGKVAGEFPLPVTVALLDRGREQYDIFCSPCHDRVGTGRGMVVQRGFKQPNSFHIDRLRQAPVGYFFDVTTTGFGMMPSYTSQVTPEDRWAIVAYIRALQLSQHATTDDVPATAMEKLQ
ncbi:MAG TPA: cytochrome c [Verrucomicrobiae bacterium]|nr:cytochrome c [Verrucomicrobiae bacterium]